MSTVRASTRPLDLWSPVTDLERPRLTLRVPVDPLAPRTPAEVLAACVAVAAHGAVELEASPTASTPDLGVHLAERCQRLRDLGATEVGWRRLSPGRVADAVLDGGAAPGTYLCMGLGSRHAPGTLLFSSVTEEVLRRSTVPVLVAGPHMEHPCEPPGQVLVAAEGSEVAGRAGVVAADLAARLGAPLRTVRVEAPAPATATRLPPTLPAAGDGAAVELVEAQDPVGAILAAVGDDPTILVIGAHKRGGRRRFALGSVALDLVRRATCPVLVVPATRPS